MKNSINKKNIFTIILGALLIVIFHSLKIDGYVKNIILPLLIMLITYIYILKDNKYINKKSYYLLIPIGLIIISNFVVKVDESNLFLNIIILPILMTIFFFSLINKNYSISSGFMMWIFKIFPNRLFSNLKFLKISSNKNKINKTISVIFGCLIGCSIGIVILSLLMSADDYFNAFISDFIKIINFDFTNVLLFVVSFIILFSILVNILMNKDCKMKKIEYIKLDEVVVKTVLVIVNIIFILFLLSEVSRLTVNFLHLPVKFTYSSYAREGFFQLLFVSIINFSIIMFLLYKSNIIKQSINIKRLVLLLISFSMILICNSFYRMFLYIGNYGFTVLRLQVILFLTMGLILFIIQIKKIIVGLKNNDELIYLFITIAFYLINLYLCSHTFIK